MSKTEYMAKATVDAVAGVAGSYTTNSGKEAIEIMFDLVTPLPDGATSIVGRMWLNDDNADRTKETLMRVGVDPAKFPNEIAFFEAITGKEFSLACGLEAPDKYHEEPRWAVRFVNERQQPYESGSILKKLKGAQASLPLTGTDDDDDPTPF